MARLAVAVVAGVAAAFVLSLAAVAMGVPESAPQAGYLALMSGALVAGTFYFASSRR